MEFVINCVFEDCVDYSNKTCILVGSSCDDWLYVKIILIILEGIISAENKNPSNKNIFKIFKQFKNNLKYENGNPKMQKYL